MIIFVISNIIKVVIVLEKTVYKSQANSMEHR